MFEVYLTSYYAIIVLNFSLSRVRDGTAKSEFY